MSSSKKSSNYEKRKGILDVIVEESNLGNPKNRSNYSPSGMKSGKRFNFNGSEERLNLFNEQNILKR